MYAIVRCGGRQEKAAVDDVLTVDTLAGEVGSTVTLPALLVVDDGNVISDPAELGGYEVTAEIMGPVAGPKINMIHYRNKTGYRRRLGHRQRYTQVKVTGIGAGGSAAKPAAKAKAPAKATAAAKAPARETAAGKPAARARTSTKAGTAKPGTAKTDTAKSGTAKAAGTARPRTKKD